MVRPLAESRPAPRRGLEIRRLCECIEILHSRLPYAEKNVTDRSEAHPEAVRDTAARGGGSRRRSRRGNRGLRRLCFRHQRQCRRRHGRRRGRGFDCRGRRRCRPGGRRRSRGRRCGAAFELAPAAFDVFHLLLEKIPHRGDFVVELVPFGIHRLAALRFLGRGFCSTHLVLLDFLLRLLHRREFLLARGFRGRRRFGLLLGDLLPLGKRPLKRLNLRVRLVLRRELVAILRLEIGKRLFRVGGRASLFRGELLRGLRRELSGFLILLALLSRREQVLGDFLRPGGGFRLFVDRLLRFHQRRRRRLLILQPRLLRFFRRREIRLEPFERGCFLRHLLVRRRAHSRRCGGRNGDRRRDFRRRPCRDDGCRFRRRLPGCLRHWRRFRCGRRGNFGSFR